MTPITATIRRLRELEAKATKGPWELCIHNWFQNVMAPGISQLHNDGNHVATCNPHLTESETNAALIVALRNAAPDLLAYVERLEKIVAVARRYDGTAEWSQDLRKVLAALDDSTQAAASAAREEKA